MPSFVFKMIRFAEFAGLVMLVVVPFGEAIAGWLIVEQKSDRYGNFGMQSTMISGQMVRIEHQTATFIFDLDSNQTTVILPRQQVYWRGHHDSLGHALYRHLDVQFNILIAQLPENERNKASEELRFLIGLMQSYHPDSLLPEHFRIEPTDSVQHILQYKSRKFLFKVDSIPVEEIWVTTDVKPWDGIDMRKLSRMMRLFSRPNLYTAYRVSDDWLSMLENGLLMRSVAIHSLGNSVVEVSTVRQLNLRKEVFLPPPDYRCAGIEELLTILMGGAEALKPDDTDRALPVKPRGASQKSSP